MPGRRAVPESQRDAIDANDGPERGVVVEEMPPVLTGPELVTLSEAVGETVVGCTLHALRKASQRDPDFPRRKGMRGLAAEYDPIELAMWDAGRR